MATDTEDMLRGLGEAQRSEIGKLRARIQYLETVLERLGRAECQTCGTWLREETFEGEEDCGPCRSSRAAGYDPQGEPEWKERT